MCELQIGTKVFHTVELSYRNKEVLFSRQQNLTPHEQYQVCDAYRLFCNVHFVRLIPSQITD